MLQEELKAEWDKVFWRRLFGYQCFKSKCTVEDEAQATKEK